LKFREITSELLNLKSLVMNSKRKVFRNCFLLLVTVLLFSTGCEEKKYVDVKPQLKIIVMKENKTKVEGARVTLHNSEKDWKNRVNELEEKYTSEQGSVVFRELEEREYYFFISKDTLDNEKGIATHKDPLEKNEKRVIEVIIK